MQGIVPAAGRGTRLRPRTDTTPKGLVAVDDTPLLSHVFDRLIEADVHEIIVVIGYRGEQIVDHYGGQYRTASLQYVEQPQRDGLADAVAQTESVLDRGQDVVVLNGDNVFGASLVPIIERHRQSAADATLVVETADRDRARQTGVVQTAEDGTVEAIVEKPADPPTELITTGAYVLPPAIVEYCRAIEPSDRGEYELAAAITRVIDQGGVVTTARLGGWRVNVSTEADRKRATRLLRA